MTGRNLIPCPSCGKHNDAQTNPRDESDAPTAGAYSICLYCGHLTMFIDTPEGLGVRSLTQAEEDELMADAFMRSLILARQAVMGDQ